MTDKDLIIGIKNNSSQIWKHIYDTMRPGIHRIVAPMLENVMDITFDDIYSDGLIILMENVKDGKLDENTPNNIFSYLCTICKRLASKRIRATKPLKEEEGETIMTTSTGGSIKIVKGGGTDIEATDPEVISEEERYLWDFLHRALSSLPKNCRQLFKRFYWDRLPMDVIAPTMGLKNANTAKTTKKRCMVKYKDLVKELLADDEKAERAIQRAVERDALRDLLERFRQEYDHEISTAACRSGKDKEPQE